MPAILSPEVKQLIDGANFAHLATLMSDGSPQSVPVWIGREGEHLVICTGENSLKGKSTRRDPRVALSNRRLHESLRSSPDSGSPNDVLIPI
jgi:nitroimidazol reductase NimA-like FMN-containing flavoprotein (pyridoxamine 5'-phosphate oxidase superfamily)